MWNKQCLYCDRKDIKSVEGKEESKLKITGVGVAQEVKPSVRP
jgi:hypothetical protein